MKKLLVIGVIGVIILIAVGLAVHFTVGSDSAVAETSITLAPSQMVPIPQQVATGAETSNSTTPTSETVATTATTTPPTTVVAPATTDTTVAPITSTSVGPSLAPVGARVLSWASLVQTVNDGMGWYKPCPEGTISLSWDAIEECARLEQKMGFSFIYILVVNRPELSDADARAELAEQGYQAMDLIALPVWHVDDGIMNTFGLDLDSKRWDKPRWDERQQVCLTLGIPIDVDGDGTPDFYDGTRGILAECMNPWFMPKEVPSTSTTAPPTTSPPTTKPSTTTTGLDKKDPKDLHPSPTTPPGTTPTVTLPSATTTTTSAGSVSGPGAMTTVIPPTTSETARPNTDPKVKTTVTVPNI